jgi:Bacterial regulatory protein, Fis family
MLTSSAKVHHSAAATNTAPGTRINWIADLEKDTILGAIAQLNGDKLTAARLLGIGKTTLYRKRRIASMLAERVTNARIDHAPPQPLRSHTASNVGNVSLRKTSSISLGDKRILLSSHQFNTRTKVEAMYAETSSG